MNDAMKTAMAMKGGEQAFAIQAQDLRQSYGLGSAELNILDGASLAIKQGEIVGLVGPSGAGKSTLLHALGLLERPKTGKISIQGQEAQSLSDGDRSRLRRKTLGFVFQHHGLLSEFSAIENVAMPLQLVGQSSGAAQKIAKESLKDVGLEERLNHRPAELSGGEQQRVAIARALANAPAIILADEPTGNLDPKTGEVIFEILVAQSRRRNCAVLAATHNLAMAERMDRMITLSEGKIVIPEKRQ